MKKLLAGILVLSSLYLFPQQKGFLSRWDIDISYGQQYAFVTAMWDGYDGRKVRPVELDGIIVGKRPIGDFFNIKIKYRKPNNRGNIVFFFMKTYNSAFYSGKVESNFIVDHFPFNNSTESYGLLFEDNLFNTKLQMLFGPVYMAFFEEMLVYDINPFKKIHVLTQRDPKYWGLEDLGVAFGLNYPLLRFEGWNIKMEALYLFNITSYSSEHVSLGLTLNFHLKKSEK